ncbi:hypothetical protein NPIL_544321 [Nephila pilipes]|uniref:Uncharacterized protein n=1 Tax=Nephila pilipes TaxID=299642 RepID=A0A8X6PA85_NEPPI|nr:hypothetical protein NPIL_544321 [Nephila pilipes]
MKFITLPDENQKSYLREDTSSDLGDSPKRKATSSDSLTETEASYSCDVTPPERNVFHLALERPRILRTGKREHPIKEYGQVSKITDCFETSPSVQEALAEPNIEAWKNAMKEEHDALSKENAWILVPRSKHKKVIGSK